MFTWFYDHVIKLQSQHLEALVREKRKLREDLIQMGTNKQTNTDIPGVRLLKSLLNTNHILAAHDRTVPSLAPCANTIPKWYFICFYGSVFDVHTCFKSPNEAFRCLS